MKKTFFILGLGRSGWETASFLDQEKIDFCVWDDAVDLQNKALARGWRVSSQWVKGGCLVCSPGIVDHPILQEAKKEGARILNDIQLFFDFFPETQAIGVTGTVGKSTTCRLLEHALHQQGVQSIVAGNIGNAIFSTVLCPKKPSPSLYILELSSYQLEHISYVPLQGALLLNLSAHHLERHHTMDDYFNIKKRIFAHAKNRLITKDLHHLVPDALSFEPCDDVLEFNKNACIQMLEALKFSSCPSLFKDFKSLPHRQEWIHKQKIRYCNDSKATSPQAVQMALKMCRKMNMSLFWIAGGVDQHDDLSILKDHVQGIEKAFLIGQAAPRYSAFLHQEKIAFQQHPSLEEAFYAAQKEALKRDQEAIILFSPGCASFDQFKNFESRGEAFKALVTHA